MKTERDPYVPTVAEKVVASSDPCFTFILHRLTSGVGYSLRGEIAKQPTQTSFYSGDLKINHIHSQRERTSPRAIVVTWELKWPVSLSIILNHISKVESKTFIPLHSRHLGKVSLRLALIYHYYCTSRIASGFPWFDRNHP